MKAFLTLEIRKSVLIELAFTKSFDKVSFFDLIKSNLLEMTKFNLSDLAKLDFLE